MCPGRLAPLVSCAKDLGAGGGRCRRPRLLGAGRDADAPRCGAPRVVQGVAAPRLASGAPGARSPCRHPGLQRSAPRPLRAGHAARAGSARSHSTRCASRRLPALHFPQRFSFSSSDASCADFRRAPEGVCTAVLVWGALWTVLGRHFELSEVSTWYRRFARHPHLFDGPGACRRRVEEVHIVVEVYIFLEGRMFSNFVARAAAWGPMQQKPSNRKWGRVERPRQQREP